MSDDLQDRLLCAHREGGSADLSRLYAEAAELREGQGDTDAACFYLTHAYVFALDAGLDTRDLHARLKARGRDE